MCRWKLFYFRRIISENVISRPAPWLYAIVCTGGHSANVACGCLRSPPPGSFDPFFLFFLALPLEKRFRTARAQANLKKLAKVSEAFDGVRQEERKRKYRAQGKEAERLKKARGGVKD